jgi:poly(3-hydroxybutyrate) depolymerase
MRARVGIAVVAAVVVAGCSDSGPASGPDGGDTPGAAADPDAATSPSPDAAAARADARPIPDCAPSAAPGHQEITCDDGVHYDVELPAPCAAGGCGVIVDIHGFTMTGDEMDVHTRMRALAPTLGYVVIQPTATGIPTSWAGGGHDDAVWSFVEATLDVVDADRDRVHVTGFSQGGEMTLRLLCAHAEDIASVAPTAAAAIACFEGGAPPVERPILYTHGTRDVLIDYDLVAIPLRDGILEAWPFGEVETMAATDGYTAERWVTASGTPFELWTHDFATEPFWLVGHCLPGPVTTDTYRCRDDGQFDQADEVLRFFVDNPR